MFAEFRQRLHIRLPAWLVVRFSGPGALYNLGNIIALSAGAGFALLGLQGQMNTLDGLHAHLMGSAPAAWLTGSILTFIVSGEIYHAAFHGPQEMRARRLQLADLVSGLAAIALTVALVGFGDTAMAVCAGALLAGGKMGSAALSFWRPEAQSAAQALRYVVLASRFPSIAALALALLEKHRLIAAPTVQDVMTPSVMIGCFLLWAWADILLLKPAGQRAGTAPVGAAKHKVRI